MKQTIISIIGVISSIAFCFISIVNLVVDDIPRITWGVMTICALVSLFCTIYNYNYFRKKNKPEDRENF